MLSLLILLPVLILVLAALWIFYLEQTKPTIGLSWLIGSLAGLLAALLLAAFIIPILRLRFPLEIVANSLRPFGTLSEPPVFVLDEHTWPYALSLAFIVLASILTDSARLESDARPKSWVAGLFLTALGLMAVMSGNPFTLILTWTAVDIAELFLVLSTNTGLRMGQQTVTAFSVRIAGQLLVVLAILFARSSDILFDFSPIPGPLALFMLLAVGLRLGVLPLNILYSREVYPSRGLANIARMIGPASSLVVLGRMPAVVMSEQLLPVFLGLTALAAVYGGAMWLSADNELNGRPYWSIALAALAIASVLNGSPQASIVWGTVLLLVGSVLFLYTHHRRGNPTIPLIAMIGLTGLPFTPAAGGWVGVFPGKFTLSGLFFILSVVFLLWGYLRHIFHARVELHRLERWVHAVYPLGLVILIIAHWLVGIFGIPGSLTVGVWWAAVLVVLITGAGAAAAFFNLGRIRSSTGSWLVSTLSRFGAGLAAFFGLGWLYGALSWIYRVVQSVIQLLTAVLEGDGGFLWSLVLLALLVSIFISRGQP